MDASDHAVATDDAVRWLRSLPESSVDAIITDPPYSSGGFNESGRRGGSSSSKALPWLMGDAMSTQTERVADDRDYDCPQCALCGRLLAPLETDARAVTTTPAPVWVPEPRGDA